ncbi:MAG TPA: sialidase family protein [Mycobacteriales bacterium]|nr:sialidase family protein [Mycobacteriales bacterium]
MTARHLALALVLAVSATTAAAAARPAPLRVRDVEVGVATLRGEGLQAGTTVEPHVAADPANPRHAVAVYQVARGDKGAGAIGISVTRDGGRTWRRSLLPRGAASTGGSYPRISDPVVAFGPGGVVHVNTLGADFASTTYRTAVLHHVSLDGGTTWEGPHVIVDDSIGGPGGTPFLWNDKNWMAVDTGSGPGHRPGRVYVTWSREVGFATFSDDNGRTWAPVSVVNAPQCFVTNPVVVSNGDLAVSCFVYGGRAVRPDPGSMLAEPVTTLSIQVAVARGAGAVASGTPLVFGAPVTVASYAQAIPQGQRAGGTISMAADPRRPVLHLAWEDTRYDGNRSDLLVATSADGGGTWAAPREVVVGDEPGAVERWAPMVAVGADGTLHLTFRSRDAEDLGEIDTYYVTSVGSRFGGAIRVNTVRTDLAYAALSGTNPFLGDYNGIATSGRLTYIVRCEAYSPRARFDGQHQTTWVAVVERR